MSALHTYPNGTTHLLPYAMPGSLDDTGDTQEQGRFCIAYSRDGWWVLDVDNWTILRWCCNEADAVHARAEYISSLS